MQHVTRSGIAYVVARLVLREDFSTIHDQRRKKLCRFLGPCQSGQIRIRGLDDKVEIVCEERGMALLLFQHTLEYHIDLEIEGTSFKGFDEKTEAHFRGELKGRSLFFFDYQDASDSRFMV